ncbi:MAG TPA: hypothetical protein VG621_00640 [Candidatus Paceibacterota bacterium]|nr:hypothetical protein [Candidatus Paceibacterota bacterium]
MIGMVITLGALIVITWLYSMFATWKLSQETPVALASAAPFIILWQRGARLGRRGWYRLEFFAKEGLSWSNRKTTTLFVKCFPKSAPIFVKRDKLTGLTHGPSSYFLKRITPTPQEAKRTFRNKRKIAVEHPSAIMPE